jgi:hypothetical protein
MTAQEKVYRLFEAIQDAEQNGRVMRVRPEDIEAMEQNRAWLLLRMNAATVLRVAYEELEGPNCTHDRAQFIRGHIRSLRWLLEGATADLFPSDQDDEALGQANDTNDLEEAVRAVLEP